MGGMRELIDKLIIKLWGWLEAFIVMLPNLVLALLVVAAAVQLSRWLERLVAELLRRLTGNQPISLLMARVARLAGMLLGLFFALTLLKLEKTVTSLLAGVGVVGLALGFAFQDIAANFMSGIMMALNRPFDVGDLVEVAGRVGRIRTLAFRATELETLDGLAISIPNKEIFQGAIVNYTQTPQRRLELTVGTAYCDDLPKVRRVVVEALAELPLRLRGRPVEVFFEEFGDSSINSRVCVWLERSDQHSYRTARSEAMIAIKAAFDREGITIPFPIRTLDFGAAVVGGVRLDALHQGTEKPGPGSTSGEPSS